MKVIFIMRDPVERLRSHARMLIPRDNYLNLDFKPLANYERDKY